MDKRTYDLKDDRRKKKKVALIQINQKWCKGCYLCLEICPQKVFGKSKEVTEKGFQPVAIIHAEKCTFCRQCEMLCPDLAIRVEGGN